MGPWQKLVLGQFLFYWKEHVKKMILSWGPPPESVGNFFYDVIKCRQM